VPRSARVIADHFEDLRAGALQEGLSEVQAEARAAERLGDPRTLAERLAAALRNSSWWGRHPVIGFCLLPSAGISLLLLLVPVLTFEALKGILPGSTCQAMADSGAGFGEMVAIIQASCYGSLLAFMIFFWWLAQRALVGVKWMLTACCLWSLQTAFTKVWYHHYQLNEGFSPHPNWICFAIPICCGLVIVIRQRHAAKCAVVTLLMAAFFLAPRAMAEEKPPLQRGWIGGEYKAARPRSVRVFFFPPPENLYDRGFPKSVQRSKSAAIKITALGTNTPAARAGLRQGDLILEVNHRPVKRLGDFRRQIDGSRPGTVVALTVYRDGATMEIMAPVGKETFRDGGNLTICLPSCLQPWGLAPDAGMSVVFAGWEFEHGLRHELGSEREVFDQSWRVWLGIFDFSLGKRVFSQTNASSSPATSQPAPAGI
jgi:hypothetical protein